MKTTHYLLAAAAGFLLILPGCIIEPNPSPASDDNGAVGPMTPPDESHMDYDAASSDGADDGGSDSSDSSGTGGDGWDGSGLGEGADANGMDGFGTGGPQGGTGGSSGTSSSTGFNGECVASCTGLQCGPDGCGGTCGWCSGSDSCQMGACVTVEGCSPDCASKMVGEEDGCGGVCSGGGMGIGLVPGGAQDAAYFRQQVLQGEIPDAELLPIEGWLTEHGTPLPAPMDDRLVTLHGFVGMFYDPIQGEPTVALQLGMNSGISSETVEAGRFNVSVVIDRSGSMQQANKIEFVKEGLIKMLDQLDSEDYLSIVTYSGAAKVMMAPRKVDDKEEIQAIIENIKPGGQTNLYAGLKLGYEQVLKNAADKDAIPRVILLSDGQANAGISDQSSILAMSGSFNGEKIGLTTIGVGSEFNFPLMHGLATQGQGNFYFLDTAEKLAQVFEEEIKYLLTPVADNLKIWFSLPEGFGVDDVYGFEYKQNEDGHFVLLNPSPQYSVADGEVVDTPPDNSGEQGDVTVSTLFASKKNGLLMVKLDSPSGDKLADYENMTLSTVHYEYELVETGEIEAFDTEIEMGSMEYSNKLGNHFFSGAIMQRNFCLLRSALAMKTATSLWHESEENLQGAINQLAWAVTFCEGINVQLNDAKLIEDINLVKTLMENICEDAGCLDPASE